VWHSAQLGYWQRGGNRHRAQQQRGTAPCNRTRRRDSYRRRRDINGNGFRITSQAERELWQ